MFTFLDLQNQRLISLVRQLSWRRGKLLLLLATFSQSQLTIVRVRSLVDWCVEKHAAYLEWVLVPPLIYHLVESNSFYCELFQFPTICNCCCPITVFFPQVIDVLLSIFWKHFLFPCRTDPHLHDMPIVYASDAFLKLTGTYQISVNLFVCLS